MYSNRKLTDIDNTSGKQDFFVCNPEKKEIPNNNPKAPKMFYYTAPIKRTDSSSPNGTDVILLLGKKWSPGVKANTNMNDGKIDGYKVPICMFSLSGPTESEKKEEQLFETITEVVLDAIQNHEFAKQCGVLPNKIQQIVASVKDKLNPLSYQINKETGERVPDKGPMLWVKLITSKKGVQPNTDESKNALPFRIVTQFYEQSDDSADGPSVNPLSLVDTRHYIQPAIKVESVYIASGMSKVSIQLKLVEAVVQVPNVTRTRLIPIKKTTETAETKQHETSTENKDDDELTDNQNSLQVYNQNSAQPAEPEKTESKTLTSRRKRN